MNSLKTNQRGFTAVEGVIIVVVLVLLGLVGWFVYDRMQKDKSSEMTTSEQVPQVEKAEDLKAVEDFLNDANVDKQLDTSEINSALNE
ncbi:MAG: hypothetical protein ACREGD_04250 [Candidatus Saccharimonadales bacterium]